MGIRRVSFARRSSVSPLGEGLDGWAGKARQSASSPGPGDRGVSSVQFLLASVLALALFMVFANIVVVQYGRGAVRSALEQGARAGSLTGEPIACVDKAEEVLGQLLGGRMSDGLVVRCVPSGNVMAASASTVFESWTPLTPDFVIEISSEALMEVPP